MLSFAGSMRRFIAAKMSSAVRFAIRSTLAVFTVSLPQPAPGDQEPEAFGEPLASGLKIALIIFHG